MIRVYRIVKPKHEAGAWTGEGAARYGGRWNHPRAPCVYCGGSLALAALELLVHLEAADVLKAYRAAWIELDPSRVRDVAPAELPVGWDDEPTTHVSRDLGTDWLYEGATVALRVPSVVVPAEYNVLLNPRHSDFPALIRGRFEPFRFDPRLAKASRPA